MILKIFLLSGQIHGLGRVGFSFILWWGLKTTHSRPHFRHFHWQWSWFSWMDLKWNLRNSNSTQFIQGFLNTFTTRVSECRVLTEPNLEPLLDWPNLKFKNFSMLCKIVNFGQWQVTEWRRPQFFFKLFF